MTKAKFLRYAALVALLFLAVRLIYLSQLLKSPILKLLILDSQFYYEWAVNLTSGHGNPQGPFWLSPLYPYFLSGLYLMTRSFSLPMTVVVQFFLSLGTLTALGYFTGKLFGKTVALVACGIAVLYGPWLYYDGTILSASLILCLNAVMLLLLFRFTEVGGDGTDPSEAPHSFSIWIWLAIGVLCGLSALARPAVLVFALALFVWLWHSRIKKAKIGLFSSRARQTWSQIGLLAVGIAVVLLPVLIRNWKVSGSPVLTTSSGGINFFIGNRSGASGVYDELDFVKSFDPWREAEGYRKEASRAVGRQLSLNEASRFWALQATRDIFEDPWDWFRLLLKKFWFTIQNEEIANNISFRGVSAFTPVTGAMPIRWGLLFPFAIAGVFLMWRAKKNPESRLDRLTLRPAAFILVLYSLSYVAVNLLFFSASEYRFPMILALLPAAGYFFVAIWQLIEQKQWNLIVAACVVYFVVLVIVNFPSHEVAKIVRPRSDFYDLATEAVDQGNTPEAIPLFARSLSVDDSFKDARVGLAQALWSLGNFDEARQEFARAGMAAPDSISGAPLQTFLSSLDRYKESGDYAGALKFLDESFPDTLNAPLDIWTNRALIESRLGQHGAAARALVKASKHDPSSPDLLFNAGNEALAADDSLLADSLYRAAIKVYPAYAPARIALGRNALARGDINAAIDQANELVNIRIPVDSISFQAEQLSADIERYQAQHHTK